MSNTVPQTLRHQIDVLLSVYPALKAEKKNASTMVVWGELHFSATYESETIDDTYHIQLFVPHTFPEDIPTLKEIGGRLPNHFHAFEDATRCLGSRTKIRLKISDNPTLLGFVNELVVPYLYSYSFKEKFNRLPYGELKHDEAGILQDYAELLDYTGKNAELAALEFIYWLSLPVIPGHIMCPCGSGIRLLSCHGTITEKLKKCSTPFIFQNEAVRCSLSLQKSGAKLPFFLTPDIMALKFWTRGKSKRRRKRAKAAVTRVLNTVQTKEANR